MGLDLYALIKYDSFKEEELLVVIKNEQELDKKWEAHTQFSEEICQKQYGMSLSEFFEEHEGSEDESEIDKFYLQSEIVDNKKSLGIPDNDMVLEGDTTSSVLNYYFKHAETIHWKEEKIDVDVSLLKNEKDHEWIPYSPHHSSDDKTSLASLIDKNSLLYSKDVPEAIKRIKMRKSINEKDILMIAFLEKYSDHTFAFI